MGSFNKARANGVSGKAGSVATIAGLMGDMRGGSPSKSAPASPEQRSGMNTGQKDNFEAEIKKRKKKPAGGGTGGGIDAGYGGSTKLG